MREVMMLMLLVGLLFNMALLPDVSHITPGT